MDVNALKEAIKCCAINNCFGCPRNKDIGCVCDTMQDAGDYISELEERIAIMQESMEALEKRNEPMKPTLNESHSYVSDAFKCGKCGHTIRFHAKYCEDCGQAVKWE